MVSKKRTKLSMRRLRLGITTTQIHHCFCINGESTDGVIGAVTPGGDMSQEQSNAKAPQALQANAQSNTEAS